jgi:regulator of replication initiation timing
MSLNDAKMAMLFAATDAGLMRAFNITESKRANFESRFGKGLYFTVTDSSGKQHQFTNFANFKTIDDFVNVFVYKLINNAGIDLLGKNINTLDTRLGAIQTTLFATKEEKDAMSKEHEKLSKKYGNVAAWDHVTHSKEYKTLTQEGATLEQLDKLMHTVGPDGKPLVSPLAIRNVKLFREAFDDWEFFRNLIEAKLNQFGVDKVQNREETTRNSVDGGNVRD